MKTSSKRSAIDVLVVPCASHRKGFKMNSPQSAKLIAMDN
jgi:hypothetical protein